MADVALKSTLFACLLCFYLDLHLVFAAQAQGRIKNRVWNRDLTYDDLIPLNLNMTSPPLLTSNRGCARYCERHEWCNSFFHSDVTGQCRLQWMVFVSPEDTIDSTGSRYYRFDTDGFVVDRRSQTCFKVSQHPLMNWTDARDACNHDNARLVVLEPLEKADFVMSLLRHNPAGVLFVCRFGVVGGGGEGLSRKGVWSEAGEEGVGGGGRESRDTLDVASVVTVCSWCCSSVQFPHFGSFVPLLLTVLGNTTRSYQIGAARPDGAWDTPFPASGLDYVWQTGIPVDYEATAGYWFSNNFASVDPNQNIVILRAEKDFLWWAAAASLKRYYICERPLEI
ncbi:hypothetical protein BaRGS_00011569 [Batillaria attramentaria]|uniref:C-type lectin domain-containing protein n=1 Tax=Batillaria attramentaria TaxID=370345 RepID=A0ABD0LD81_9CAEN